MSTTTLKNQTDLGKILKARRKALGLTQKEVAKYCNLSHNGLSQIELARQSIRLSTLLKLTALLGFHVQITTEED